ncbi:MAG: DUF427 domain-containing protein [Chitinophagaceae bacterium]|nr:DUF427 domain-containing protein [Chitinophagaceae bacterium]
MKAIFNGTVIAESDNTILVEGNHYFPAESIRKEYFTETSHHSVCPWKGLASYYTVSVNGQQNENAAWFYKNPMPAAAEIRNYVAFWKGVSVQS